MKITNLSLLIVLIVLTASTSCLAALYTDGIYSLPQKEIVTNTAQETPEIIARESDTNILDSISSWVSGFMTNLTFDIDTQNFENEEVDQVKLSGNLSMYKGPLYVNYRHQRNYQKDYYAEIPNFYGTINNRITFGVNLTPNNNAAYPSNMTDINQDSRVRLSSAKNN